MSEDTLKNAIEGAKQFAKKPGAAPAEAAAALGLVERSKICLLGTNGPDGFPAINAMLNLRHEGLKTIWLSTNTSSKHVARLRQDERACLYYVDETHFQGLLLAGTVELCRDEASRKLLWTDGAEVYYPKGVDDPDYTVLRFTARRGNWYFGLANTDFVIP